MRQIAKRCCVCRKKVRFLKIDILDMNNAAPVLSYPVPHVRGDTPTVRYICLDCMSKRLKNIKGE